MKNLTTGVQEAIDKLTLLNAYVIRSIQNSKKTLVIGIFIALAVLSFGLIAKSRISTAASYRGHVAQNDCRDWGTLSLVNEATQTVVTGCKVVEACQTGISNNPGSTATTNIICNIPSQTATATIGTINVRADTVGGTMAGTATVSWGVDGYSTN